VPIHQQWHGFLFIYFTLKLFIVVEAYNRAYTDPYKPLAAYATISAFFLTTPPTTLTTPREGCQPKTHSSARSGARMMSQSEPNLFLLGILETAEIEMPLQRSDSKTQE
jgi:hypothetical protein